MPLSPKSSISNSWLKLVITSIAAFSIAGITPQEGQLIELKNFVNARAESKFRPTDDNKIYELRQGTKAVIGEKPVEFKDPKTKKPYAYGLCLKILNAEVSNKKDCYWVYYREGAKNLEIHDVQGEDQKKLLATWQAESGKKIPLKVLDEKFKTASAGADKAAAAKTTITPKEKLPVHVTQDTQAIHEPHYPKAKSETKEVKKKEPARTEPKKKEQYNMSSGADSMDASIINKMNELNSRLNTDAMKPEPAKQGCDGKCATQPLNKDEKCVPGKNDYLETDMSQLSTDPQSVIAQLLNINQPEKYIKDECFATALKFKGGSFKTCSQGQSLKQVDRPCASTALKKVARNSFNLTMDCLGEYLTNDAKTVPSAATNFFFLIAHESGHNPNAVSWSGAGGSTQLTDPVNEQTKKPAGAITHFNKVEKEVMSDYLDKKNDPRCSPIKQVLTQGMGEGPQNTCDRISLQKGNPLLNLVYGLGYQKFLRRNVTKFITHNPMANRKFSNLDPKAKEHLENQLSLWSHNTGPSGMTHAMIHYLAKNPNQQVSSVKDVTEMLAAMKSSIKAEGRSVAEPANYLAAVNKRSELILSSTGGGTCEAK